MSIKATLHIDDKKINVLYYYYDFYQPTDANNRPSGKPIFQGVRIVLETQQDLSLEEWAVAANQKKQLKLHLSPITLGGKTRIVYFIDAHLVKWDVSFTNKSSTPMIETLFITCGGLREGSVEFEAYWRTTYPNKAIPTKVHQEEELEVINYYITDLENNILDNYSTGDKILLHVETKNAIDKSLTLSLNDKKNDFKHNGVILENDTLKNYTITNNFEKIELEVIEQQS
ncbi:MAG: hypothetical protein L3J23_08870 [Flavobacteriaceae bacterium]|nr:hypothetical protein [Flavobacteriaceae bacterium]